mmetsp:Transcript_65253/g.181422  ORF Transcript_65253/g.181422 Transcript_65253/m.181422 type:complete len:306 (+) Transcript_65253:61-978(+)
MSWRRRHVAALHRKAKATADAYTSDDAEAAETIEIALKLPNGEKTQETFREGMPVACIALSVLDSSWAKSHQPWGLRLVSSYPRRELMWNGTITKELHRANVTIEEDAPPNDADELQQTVIAAEKEATAAERGELFNEVPPTAAAIEVAAPSPVRAVPAPEEARESQLGIVQQFTGASCEAALQALQATGWDTQSAVNAIVDSQSELAQPRAPTQRQPDQPLPRPWAQFAPPPVPQPQQFQRDLNSGGALGLSRSAAESSEYRADVLDNSMLSFVPTTFAAQVATGCLLGVLASCAVAVCLPFAG